MTVGVPASPVDRAIQDTMQRLYDEGYAARVKDERARIMKLIQADDSPQPDLTQVFLEDLDLSERPRNCLKRAQCNTVAEIISFHNRRLEDGGLFNIVNFGMKSFEEVNDALAKYGVTLETPPMQA